MPVLPFQPAPGIAQVETRYIWNGQRCEMVFHVDYAGTGFVSAIVTPFVTLGQSLRAIQAASCVFAEVYAKDIAIEDGPATTSAQNAPGTVNTGSINNTLAPCVTLRTNRTGRSYTGRKYFPGLAAGYQDVNTITSLAVTALNDAFDNLLLDVAGQGNRVVVLSRVMNGARRPSAIGTPVQFASLRDNLLDNQRRRKPGVGS